jgi:two-component system chemotaxis sensor kinase CheA
MTGASPDSIRVNTEKLDNMLLKVEELLSIKQASELMAVQIKDAFRHIGDWKRVRAKSRFARKQKRAPSESPDDESATAMDEFLSNLDSFSSRFESDMTALTHSAVQNQRLACAQIDTLMEDVKKLLMQPFSTLLDGMPRIVRDLAKDLGKEADFVARCGDIEMDRRILDEMRDPLIHLIRNCLDHGIEKAGERLLAGKKACGRISIAVERRSGQKAEITVSDDGAGLNTLKIKEAAVKNGLIAASEADALPDEAAHLLIFHSGLSTSPIITDLSGRGLGMAIVRERIEKLGGRVTVETRSGQGAVFRILLPTARATFRGVLVRVRERHFVFPTFHIDRVVRVKNDEIRSMANREAISLEGRLISLARLADVLGLEPAQGRARPPLVQPAVVVHCGGQTVAFLVDAVIAEHEILLKNLGGQLRRVRNIEGATVLQGGKLVPVLNVFDLFKSALEASASRLSKAEFSDAAPASKRILVVEDSITSRTLLKNIIEAAHYEVETAVDGIDGFTKMRDGRFDLVVSDVEMPRLHGFDLTLRIRKDEQLSQTPVILVTARESREDRERGIEVGANAYIVKSSFDQANLIEVIRRFL